MFRVLVNDSCWISSKYNFAKLVKLQLKNLGNLRFRLTIYFWQVYAFRQKKEINS